MVTMVTENHDTSMTGDLEECSSVFVQNLFKV